MEVFGILAPLGDAVVLRWRDQQDGADHGGQQAAKMNPLRGSGKLLEPLRKYVGQLKAKQRLRSGKRHPAFDQNYFDSVFQVGWPLFPLAPPFVLQFSSDVLLLNAYGEKRERVPQGERKSAPIEAIIAGCGARMATESG